MFKFFWKFVFSGNGRSAPAWQQDPLSHPDIHAMSLRELADLPLPAEVPTARIAERRALPARSNMAKPQSILCQLANRPASAP